jgi:hypothetical protein
MQLAIVAVSGPLSSPPHVLFRIIWYVFLSDLFTSNFRGAAMPDSRAAKKKELYQLAIARSDITAAMTTCDLIIQHVKELGSDLYQPLFHAMVIAYARPFTHNKPLGRLPGEWSKFSDPHFQEAHDALIRSRHQYIAHSDEEIKKVLIFPHGAALGETGLKSGGISLTVKTMGFPLSWFPYIRNLCLDLGSRLDVRVNNLLAELYAERKLPAEAFPLTFDNNL